MANTVKFTIKQKSDKTTQWVEGVYQLSGSTSAKVAQKDGTTRFTNSAALKASAKRLASSIGREAEFAQPEKKAAKKSLKTANKSKPAKKEQTNSTSQTTNS